MLAGVLPAILLAILLAILALPAVAQETDCGSGSHAEARACLERTVAKSESDLQRMEARLVARIALWDAEPPDVRHSLRLFDADRKTYRAYRAAQCELQASAAAGGNGAGDLRAMCVIEQDRARMALLRAHLDRFELAD